MSNITFKQEQYHEIIQEIKPLLQDHYKEIALYQDKVKLDPDYERYEFMGNLGYIKFYTVRDCGKLVGYFIVTVTDHLHYKKTRFANNDVIFLKKEYRTLGVGKKLIQFVEKKLKKDKVDVLVINTKAHQPFDPLMQVLNYNLDERVYSKYIGDN